MHVNKESFCYSDSCVNGQNQLGSEPKENG